MMMVLLHRDENIVGNGEIAHHEQFLHLPHCFQNVFKTSSVAVASKRVSNWESVKSHTAERWMFVSLFKAC